LVTVSSYVQRESKDGKKFYALILRSGMELVLSEESGRYYATAKEASITNTFDEKTCQGLVGTKLPGKISKVACDPFEYTVQESGEVILINHRWVYSPSEASLEESVYDKEPIGVASEF